MSAKETITTEASLPEEVDAYMAKLKHPLHKVAQQLRELLLSADKSVGEKIAWNAPSFFYTGKMKPFNPKEYKRYFVVFNFTKKDCIRLVFLKGGLVNDSSGLLEGTYTDGRRIATIRSVEEVKEREKDLKKILKELVQIVKKEEGK